MKYQDLCPDCQKKMPLMDYDKAVDLIQAVIKTHQLDVTASQINPMASVSAEYHSGVLDRLARLAHEAIYSTPKEG